ncbi:hypothetical protein BDK51DRAFT_40083 [Blyttiomyces helicus]|uniref:F-box domain-containing protein n=1 Tax=Blyttiomyces helicus TaxID=388810 RepID=A0A4P9WAA5_9FUNG|nr:hypothetical protein BDK51DRAFT_40083 [Blyttiomyces helicus]|eukprot:RKO89142.1 hypothetical protein BDK51DRAFT_40083 [Blyttiomyces helicus]
MAKLQDLDVAGRETSGLSPQGKAGSLSPASAKSPPQYQPLPSTSIAMTSTFATQPPRRPSPNVPYDILYEILRIRDIEDMLMQDSNKPRTIVSSSLVSRMWAAVAKELLWERVSAIRRGRRVGAGVGRAADPAVNSALSSPARRSTLAVDDLGDGQDMASDFPLGYQTYPMRILSPSPAASLASDTSRPHAILSNPERNVLPVSRPERGPAIKYWWPGATTFIDPSSPTPDLCQLEILESSNLEDGVLVTRLLRTHAPLRRLALGRLSLTALTDTVESVVRLLKHFRTIEAISLQCIPSLILRALDSYPPLAHIQLDTYCEYLDWLLTTKGSKLRVLDVGGAYCPPQIVARFAHKISQLEAIGLRGKGRRCIVNNPELQVSELPFKNIAFLEDGRKKCPRLRRVVLLESSDTVELGLSQPTIALIKPLEKRTTQQLFRVLPTFRAIQIEIGFVATAEDKWNALIPSSYSRCASPCDVPSPAGHVEDLLSYRPAPLFGSSNLMQFSHAGWG